MPYINWPTSIVCPAFFGYNYIPLRIINTVTRSDFPYWPNVQRKFYSEEDSLLIFDHYFKSPPLIT